MANFRIKLAGRIIDISSLHDDIRRLCRDYIIADAEDAEADIVVLTKQADIDYERSKSYEIDDAEGHPHREYSDGYLETLAVYRQIADAIIAYDTVLFHGSAVAIDGEAYIFAALSGTGKSTHRRLWQEAFGERVTVVNDDKPLIRVESREVKEEGVGSSESSDSQGGAASSVRVTVCGTPWDGKHRVGTNVEIPVRAICILERGEVNEIHEVTFAEALPSLITQTHRPDDPGRLVSTLNILGSMASGVKFYRLSCNMDPDAARVAYEGMKR